MYEYSKGKQATIDDEPCMLDILGMYSSCYFAKLRKLLWLKYSPKQKDTAGQEEYSSMRDHHLTAGQVPIQIDNHFLSSILLFL